MNVLITIVSTNLHTQKTVTYVKRFFVYACTFFFLLGLFSSRVALAQNPPGKELKVKKAISTIKLDGELNEADWENAISASSFFQNYPNDSLPASHASEAYLPFDDR